jgi:PAS domain S-box-containing protein
VSEIESTKFSLAKDDGAQRNQRKVVLMRCQLPVSKDLPEISDACELAYSTKIDDSVFRSVGDPPKRGAAAMHPTSPRTRKIARGTPQELRILREGAVGKRITLVSRASVLTNMEEEVDRELLQAQDNFATLFHASPAILCIIQLDGLLYREINKAYEQRTGYGRSEVLGKSSLKLGLWNNADDRKKIIQKFITEGCLRSSEVVFRTKNGERLTTLLSAEIIEFGGERCALVTAEDISRQRQAEEDRMILAQRLINAQEAECRRVARELHDNVGQSLALFSMELEKTRLAFADLSPDTDARFDCLCARVKSLNHEVGSLSHQLHSSELELLGLGVAIKRLCRDFSEQYQVQAHCECFGIPDDLSNDMSLCLFRVTQEALHNIAKHSRATRISVSVRGTLKSLYLCVSDDGIGFTSSIFKAGVGLGLISMRERISLIGGKFIITAKSCSGTRVEADIPLMRTSTNKGLGPLDQSEDHCVASARKLIHEWVSP